MKKNFLLLLFLVLLIPVLAQNVNVTFKLKLIGGLDTSKGVYIVGEISNWQFLRMTREYDSVYTITVNLKSGDSLAYYYILNNTWDNYKSYREYPPEDGQCTPSEILKRNPEWKGDRAFVVPKKDTTIKDVWGNCETFVPQSLKNIGFDVDFRIYPLPVVDVINIETKEFIQQIIIYDGLGRVVFIELFSDQKKVSFDISKLANGIYILKIQQRNNSFYNFKFVKQ